MAWKRECATVMISISQLDQFMKRCWLCCNLPGGGAGPAQACHLGEGHVEQVGPRHNQLRRRHAELDAARPGLAVTLGGENLRRRWTQRLKRFAWRGGEVQKARACGSKGTSEKEEKHKKGKRDIVAPLGSKSPN